MKKKSNFDYYYGKHKEQRAYLLKMMISHNPGHFLASEWIIDFVVNPNYALGVVTDR